MCDTCGCDGDGDIIENEHSGHEPRSDSRMVAVQTNLLSANSQIAAQVRAHLASKHVLAINLVSSPGSGKTTLLIKTLEALMPTYPAAVIEGDQQTCLDAQQIRATGASAVQINTGTGCHLDALGIRQALRDLEVASGGVLFIENVGNLVCPALFDLGEAHKVVVLSVPEGDDKPAKYPHMFAASDLMIINKTDLLPFVDFDVERCVDHARRANPDIEVVLLSARTGGGLPKWIEWLEKRIEHTGAVEERRG